MSSLSNLLIEIYVEEMPSWYQARLQGCAGGILADLLHERGIDIDASIELSIAPRHIIMSVKDLPHHTKEKTTKLYSPPLSVAYKDGAPTRAMESFVTKNSLSLEMFENKEALARHKIELVQKNGKEVYTLSLSEPGEPIDALLPSLVLDLIRGFNFSKSMFWDTNALAFIRPIRNVMVFFGTHFIKVAHPSFSSKPIAHVDRNYPVIDLEDRYKDECFNPRGYYDLLQSHGVIVDAKDREALILSGIERLEREHLGLKVGVDSALLEELVYLSESPRVVLGEFDASFLALPSEVIITSMQEHQRYFAVYKEGDEGEKTLDAQLTSSKNALSNHFIVVANSINKDLSAIKAGNERVLKARLKDAMFFYENDLARDIRNYDLANVLYLKELGSMKDKVQRERIIGAYLCERYEVEDASSIDLAISISKNDLLSEMVNEFPSLEGIMGSYYARASLALAKDSEEIAKALYTQYLPNANKSLPIGRFSSIVALANKLDSLLSLFSIGKAPTGSKDPYALRRAALGVIAICESEALEFDIEHDVSALARGYAPFDTSKLSAFFIERLASLLRDEGINERYLRAIINSGEHDIASILADARALYGCDKAKILSKIIPLYKRVANLCKKQAKEGINQDINNTLFGAYEDALYHEIIVRDARILEANDLYTKLEILCELAPFISDLFEHVLINDENLALRDMRLALLDMVYRRFIAIADLEELIS